MPSIAIHKEHVKEHIEIIKDAVLIGIDKRPATIGLHTSACSAELLEFYLHKLGKITTGAMIKHEWFKKPKPEQKTTSIAERKLPMIFPLKKEIFGYCLS